MYMPKNPLPFSVRGILYHLDGRPHLLSVLDAEVLLLEDALEDLVEVVRDGQHFLEEVLVVDEGQRCEFW